MARIVSFVVLVAILLLIAGLFFQVMANFLLPMFLAMLLVVIFKPLHLWLIEKCKGRSRLAAGLTTASIILILLVPLLLILLQAGAEGLVIYENIKGASIDLHRIAGAIVDVADSAGLSLSVDEVEKNIGDKVQQWLTPLALSTTQYVGSFLISLFVMIISLYYFLADGPAMVRTIMRLSPLDDKYEEQLVDQFQDLTRAVVIATLLSATVQGLLAGVGFYFVKLQSVFLLMVFSMLFAMVPFVGAAAVWVPVCLWLYFGNDGSTAKAVLLAIYCGAIVSMADNVIKPLVLHGRANLHPLLALLSVLGGVQALGPIGIFVGPMVVAFLQTLLNMLHTELDSLGNHAGGNNSSDEDSSDAAAF